MATKVLLYVLKGDILDTPTEDKLTVLASIGATGNIGGAVLEDVLKTYPDVTVVAQVRSEKDSDILKNQYAQYGENLQTVVTGDNSDALKKVTESASIVISTHINDPLKCPF